MHREYHKWWSPRLNRDMEMLIYGHGGRPLLVFPSSMGKFFEYEDRDMIGTLSWRINNGHLRVFCVDSIDTESFYCKWAHPSGRIRRHEQYESYVVHEVLPLIGQYSGNERVAVTGCSFGAYHCVNFALRHPDCVSACVAMSGAYDIRSFMDGYYDNEVYFNNPVDFLPQTGDPWFLGKYRHDIHWIFAAGEHDICLDATRRMSQIFHARGIYHWFDVFGYGAVHDWPLWREMAAKYLG